jgi:hypothetical protein
MQRLPSIAEAAAGRSTLIIVQAGHFYFDAVVQYYVSANTKAL